MLPSTRLASLHYLKLEVVVRLQGRLLKRCHPRSLDNTIYRMHLGKCHLVGLSHCRAACSQSYALHCLKLDLVVLLQGWLLNSVIYKFQTTSSTIDAYERRELTCITQKFEPLSRHAALAQESSRHLMGNKAQLLSTYQCPDMSPHRNRSDVPSRSVKSLPLLRAAAAR